MTISEEIRKLILLKAQDGHTKKEIASMCNISERTVFRILSTIKPVKPIGLRDKKIKNNAICVKRAFKAVERSKLLVTATRVSKKLPCSLSVRSIRRYLRKIKLKYKRITRKIILSPAQKLKRVEIVRGWFCSKLDPDEIVFTDESRFSLDGNDSMLSWTDGNSYSRPLRPFKGGSIMIWGAIAKTGLVIIRKITGTLNSEKYCNLLEHDVLPILNVKLGPYIFQQDNASCHVSRKTKTMFERHGVRLLNWPAKSPDLSPIEKLWAILKLRIYVGSTFNSLNDVWCRINDEINIINTDGRNLIQSLYNNYLSKMCDILCNGGNILL